MTRVLVRHIEKKQVEKRSHGKMEVETGETLPHAREHPEPPEAGRGREDPPLEALWGDLPC